MVQVDVETPAGKEVFPLELVVEHWGMLGPLGVRACQNQLNQVQEQIRQLQLQGVEEPRVIAQGKLKCTKGKSRRDLAHHGQTGIHSLVLIQFVGNQMLQAFPLTFLAYMANSTVSSGRSG